jgi:hypothetical protein
MDEHESLKLFTSDLDGMKLGDEGYEDKLHQLMEVGGGWVCLVLWAFSELLVDEAATVKQSLC